MYYDGACTDRPRSVVPYFDDCVSDVIIIKKWYRYYTLLANSVNVIKILKQFVTMLALLVEARSERQEQRKIATLRVEMESARCQRRFRRRWNVLELPTLPFDV